MEKKTEEKISHIEVSELDMGYGSFILMHDLNFTIRKGDTFIIM